MIGPVFEPSRASEEEIRAYYAEHGTEALSEAIYHDLLYKDVIDQTELLSKVVRATCHRECEDDWDEWGLR